jgi:hypothetical protein
MVRFCANLQSAAAARNSYLFCEIPARPMRLFLAVLLLGLVVGEAAFCMHFALAASRSALPQPDDIAVI